MGRLYIYNGSEWAPVTKMDSDVGIDPPGRLGYYIEYDLLRYTNGDSKFVRKSNPISTNFGAYWVTSNSSFTGSGDRFNAGAFSAEFYGYGAACTIWNVKIPKDAEILSSKLSIVCSTVFTGTDVRTYFDAIDEDNAGAPVGPYATFMARARTTAQVNWNISEVWSLGTVYTSPDLSPVFQEIVNRAGWVSGNYIIMCWNDNSSPTDANNLRRGANIGNLTYDNPFWEIKYRDSNGRLYLYEDSAWRNPIGVEKV